VQILFEELMKAIEPWAAAARARDFSQRGTARPRASILHGLEGSLDFDQGGDIAPLARGNLPRSAPPRAGSRPQQRHRPA
jgi:hypothetical protein